tara:strand:- start:718 stop:888 length:171 start_codon:yes stop_codon:yes gene_type:complete
LKEYRTAAKKPSTAVIRAPPEPGSMYANTLPGYKRINKNGTKNLLCIISKSSWVVG